MNFLMILANNDTLTAKIRRASGPRRVRPGLAWNGKREKGRSRDLSLCCLVCLSLYLSLCLRVYKAVCMSLLSVPKFRSDSYLMPILMDFGSILD